MPVHTFCRTPVLFAESEDPPNENNAPYQLNASKALNTVVSAENLLLWQEEVCRVWQMFRKDPGASDKNPGSGLPWLYQCGYLLKH